LLFLAEVETAQTASALVERAEAASTGDRPRVAGNDNRLLMALIGGSTTRGQKALETEASLRLIYEVLRVALRR
jgi:hypothetical protein